MCLIMTYLISLHLKVFLDWFSPSIYLIMLKNPESHLKATWACKNSSKALKIS